MNWWFRKSKPRIRFAYWSSYGYSVWECEIGGRKAVGLNPFDAYREFSQKNYLSTHENLMVELFKQSV